MLMAKEIYVQLLTKFTFTLVQHVGNGRNGYLIVKINLQIETLRVCQNRL